MVYDPNEWYRWVEVKDIYGIELGPEKDVIYCESYSDWSWGNCLTIYEEEGRTWYVEGDEWNPQPCTIEDAIAMMLNFEEDIEACRNN